MGKKITGLCAGLVIAGCVLPGSVWLAHRQDQVLLSHVNQVLTSNDVDATVVIRGRVATITSVDPQDAEQAASVIVNVPGVARVETPETAQPGTSAQPSGPVPTTQNTTSTSTSPSTSPSSSPSPSPSPTPTPSPAPVPSLEPIFFDGGSTELRADAGPRIDELARILIDRPELVVRLIGHTDNGLTMDQRDAIGLARAQTVADALIARGVAGERIAVENRGDREPLGDNATQQGLELNRRVQIVLEVRAG